MDNAYTYCRFPALENTFVAVSHTPNQCNVLIAGQIKDHESTKGLVNAVLAGLQETGLKLKFSFAENSEKTLDLLRENFWKNKQYDIVILTEKCDKPYDIGSLTSMLIERRRCGEVILISSTPDNYRTGMLNMTLVQNIQNLETYLKEINKTSTSTGFGINASSKPEEKCSYNILEEFNKLFGQ